MTNLFEAGVPNQVQIPENAYDSLVGEGKKYKDNEALSRSRYEADNFIEVLKHESKSKDAELSALKDELKTRMTMQEFVELMKTTPQNESLSGSPPDSGSQIKHQDLDKLLDEKLNQRRQQELVQTNVAKARDELTKFYGASYQDKLRDRAAELGVTPEFLQSVAERSPQALIELVKPKAPESPPSGAPSSSVRLPSGSPKRNLAWFENEMKKNKKLRYDSNFQIQMHREAAAQGQEFFK